MTDERLLTVLEARVPKERWGELRAKYEALGRAEVVPERVGGYLAQDAEDPEIWRGFSLWRSAAALQAYRARVGVPAGLALFREVARGDVKLQRMMVLVED